MMVVMMVWGWIEVVMCKIEMVLFDGMWLVGVWLLVECVFV